MKKTKANRIFRENNTIGKSSKPKFQIYADATITQSDYNLKQGVIIKKHVNKLIKDLIEVIVRYDASGNKYPVRTKIYVKEITEQIKNRM